MAPILTQKVAKPQHSMCARSFEIEKGSGRDFSASMVRKAGEYLESGDVPAAEKCLRMVLQQEPGHPQCLAYLAICVAVGRQDLPAAEDLARKLIKSKPNDATAYYALGRIDLMGGRRRSAFRHFHKASRLAVQDPVLQGELERIEPRRGPVIPFLSRNHPLNISLGRLRARLLPRHRR